MKKIKLLSLLMAVVIGSMLSSCDFSNPTTIEGGNADIQTDIVTLRANNWLLNSKYQFQWYQEVTLTSRSLSVSEDGVVIAYYLNEYGGWEALPATSVFWDEQNVVYSTEFWYSYDERNVYFDYRNTKPANASAPAADIDVKLVIIDKMYFDKIKSKGVNPNNYDELISKVTSDGGKIHSCKNATR